MHSSSNLMDEVFFALCKQADTPISLSAWLRYKYSHKELLELDMKFGDYLECDVQRLRKDYACVSFLSKWKGLNTGVDLEAVAIQKFTSSEVQCKETNERLRRSRVSPIKGTFASRIYLAKRKIARLLGPFSLFAIEPYFGWGPGATFDIPRRKALVDTKMVTVPISASRGAAEFLGSLISRDLHWSFSLLGTFPSGPFSWVRGVFDITSSCRVETVDKNAKTNRVIAIEPTANLFLQKGVGGFVRRRLKRVGVDLDNQGINQYWAKNALDLDLATLDLKAASDSVSRELVYELLPLDWASFMDSIRSKTALLPDGSVVELEKFSSMGNGFTFELESLIFWALTSVLTDELHSGGVLSIYGDDIICQKQVSSELVETLGFVGFSVNEDKSFFTGLFYESCGDHYFNRVFVTPPYQKEVYDQSTEYIRSANRLFRWSERSDLTIDAHSILRRKVDSGFRLCLLPQGVEGDDGFLCATDEFVTTQFDQIQKIRSNMSRKRFPKKVFELNKLWDPSRGFRAVVVTSLTRRLPGVESALLANSLRQVHDFNPDVIYEPSSWNEPLEGEASYGDVIKNIRGSKPSDSESGFGRRWIIPPGYCPLAN